MRLRRRSFLLLSLAVLLGLVTTATPLRADGALKTWLTAELLGAMRWAKQEAPKGEKGKFGLAEVICYKRLQKQIDAGSISRAAAFLIAENTRKTGQYRREQLTLERAEELRKTIVAGRIFEGLKD